MWTEPKLTSNWHSRAYTLSLPLLPACVFVRDVSCSENLFVNRIVREKGRSWTEVPLYMHTHRVIKKSLCIWWFQYRQSQVMFKLSPASLQTFIDTRLTLTPSVIPNSNYVIMVSDWNCLKYLCRATNQLTTNSPSIRNTTQFLSTTSRADQSTNSKTGLVLRPLIKFSCTTTQKKHE
jgi:hypothetical protein